jgi:hypothetical protein
MKTAARRVSERLGDVEEKATQMAACECDGYDSDSGPCPHILRAMRIIATGRYSDLTRSEKEWMEVES